MSKFKNVKADLKAILEEKIAARSENIDLYYIYIKRHYGIKDTTDILTFFVEIIHKRIPSFDTVTRLSRQIQQQNPHLRGKNWEKRHGQQREVINDLKNND